MPVWGARFYAETQDANAVQARIAELVAYLESIQTSARHARQQLPRGEGDYARQ